MFSSPSSISGNDAEASDLGEPSLRGKANELSLSEVAISSTGQTMNLSFHRLDPMHCHLQTQILPFPGPERDTKLAEAVYPSNRFKLLCRYGAGPKQ